MKFNETNVYENRNFKYNPTQDGAVIAIRIYFLENTRIPMADLKFAYITNITTICWVQTHHREAFSAGISGYTLIYDEREKPDFNMVD